MKKLQRIAALIIIACMIFMVVGCNQDAEDTTPANGNGNETTAAPEDVSITIVHQYPPEDMENSPEGTIWNEMTDQFVADHPNADIDIVAINQAELHVKIQAQAAADDLPEAFMLKGSWVTNFVENDLVVDFKPYVDELSYKDDYKPGIFEPFTRNGKIFGMPVQFAATSLVYYNSDLWSQVGYDQFPDNWDDILDAVEKFNEMGITPFAAGNQDRWFIGSCWLSTMGDRFTGTEWTMNIVDKNNQASFNDPEFVSALSFMQTLTDSKLFNLDFNSITNNQSVSLYAEGRAATTIDGYWAIGAINNQASDEIIEATKLTIMPQVPEQKGTVNAASGGAGWSIAASSRTEGAAKDLAVDYCLYITNDESSRRYAEEYGGVGAISIDDIDMTEFGQIEQDYFELINSIDFTPIYDIVMDAAVIEVMNVSLQDMLNGTMTPDAVAQTIQEEYERSERESE